MSCGVDLVPGIYIYITEKSCKCISYHLDTVGSPAIRFFVRPWTVERIASLCELPVLNYNYTMVLTNGAAERG